jgi:hypothetical protein
MGERVRDVLTDNDPEGGHRYVVTWKEEDGVVRSTGPFHRNRARQLVDAFQQLAPQRTHRLESLLQAVDDLKLGRIQRRRVARGVTR